MFDEVFHDLVIEEGVEEFGDDGKERDGAVVFGEGFVFLFVEFDYFGEFEGVWVFLFLDCLVEEFGEDWC